MDIATRGTDAADEAPAVVAAWLAAARAQDVPGVMAHYAPDVVSCEPVGPLRVVGRAAGAAHWAACMEGCRETTMDIRDLRAEASGDLAVCHFVLECGGTGPDGVARRCTLRATSCLRRDPADGRWRIAHDHLSVPFDPVTMRALDDAPG